MTTPNRPPFPDWYQAERRVPPHAGPTQREMLARRIRSLRKLLIGVSFIGVATFSTLAAQHHGTAVTATTSQNGTTALAQQNTSSQSVSTSNTSTSGVTLSPATSQTSSSQAASSFRTRTATS